MNILQCSFHWMNVTVCTMFPFFPLLWRKVIYHIFNYFHFSGYTVSYCNTIPLHVLSQFFVFSNTIFHFICCLRFTHSSLNFLFLAFNYLQCICFFLWSHLLIHHYTFRYRCSYFTQYQLSPLLLALSHISCTDTFL